MTDGFLSHLAQLQQSYLSQRTHLDGVVHASEDELAKIALTFRSLEEQRIEVNRRKYHALEALNGLKNDQQEENLELIFKEFNDFQRFMANYLEQNMGVREDLQRQLESVLTQDPTLEQELADYHEFASKQMLALESMPAFYRKTFEDAIQKQVLRLKVCLDYEDRLKGMPDRSDGIVPIVLSFDIEQSQMFWALPAAGRTETQDGTFSQRMDGLENAFIQVLSLLAKDPDWTLLDVERGLWAGFRSLTTLVEYTGQIPMRVSIQEYLEQKLAETWPFKNLTPIPEIAELDWETWLIGQARPGAVLDLKAAIPEVEEGAVAIEPKHLVVETTSRLFTDKDVTAWERPLRVSEDSAWTVSARRLRTLLIRMSSQGRIGRDGVQLDQIFASLPQEHAESFKRLFPALIENGLLSHEASNNSISLNPDHLADVQDLINRDVTQYWAPIIA